MAKRFDKVRFGITIVLITLLVAIVLIITVNMAKSELSFFNKVQQNSQVKISQNVLSILNGKYDSLNVEYISCIYGDVDDEGIIYINDVTFPEVVEEDRDHVKFIPCQKGFKYLGTIHSHTGYNVNYCELSKTDIYTFGSDKEAVIIGVQCDIDRFGLFLPYYWQKSLKWSVK